MIGGLFSNNYTGNFFRQSAEYLTDDLTWCVSRVESLPFWLKIRFMTTKIAWILCYLIVIVISIVLLCLFKSKEDRFGYMNYEFNRNRTHQRVEIPSISSQIILHNSIWTVNINRLNISNAFLLIACILITIAWNFVLVKTIAWPTPVYQVRTIDEMIERYFRLTGGPFANVSTWKHSKVKFNKNLHY